MHPDQSLRLLTQRQVADMLRVTPRTVERWRETGAGPTFFRVGGLCRYRPEDLAAWLDARRCTSTSTPRSPNSAD